MKSLKTTTDCTTITVTVTDRSSGKITLKNSAQRARRRR